MVVTLATGYTLIFKAAGIGLVGGLAEMLVQHEGAKFVIRLATMIACGWMAYELIDGFLSELVTFGRNWI